MKSVLFVLLSIILLSSCTEDIKELDDIDSKKKKTEYITELPVDTMLVRVDGSKMYVSDKNDKLVYINHNHDIGGTISIVLMIMVIIIFIIIVIFVN